MMEHVPEKSRSEAAAKLRLFIALVLPEEVRQQLATLSKNLQKGFQFTSCRPSWADPETMHLTLIFLGATAGEWVKPIGQALGEVTAEFGPQRLEVKRLGVFPNWRGPKVLWAGIRDRTHQLEDLQKALERRMEKNFGYQPEARPFHPHLTLARFKSLKGTSATESIVNNHQGFKFGPFIVPELVLFQSDLDPQGARHTALYRAPFGKGEPEPEGEEDDEG